MSVSDNQVIRQCLSHLPLQDSAAPNLDHRKQKLNTANLMKIFTMAQLLQSHSLDYIEKLIRADEQLQAEFGLASISKAQLSRRIQDLPGDIPQALFHAIVDQIQSHSAVNSTPKKLSLPLAIVDSTNLTLPFQLSNWAKVSKHRSGVKIHTRLMVIDTHSPYPDQVIPSMGKVSDYEGSDLLVVDQGVLYVMDRGYVCYKRMERWVTNQLEFVIRVNTRHFAAVLEEYAVPDSDSFIRRDVKVLMGNNARTEMSSAVRLIEFEDEQGRLYRLATTRWDLSAKEITDIYRQRWLIELFFKWMKQHLRVTQLYSHQPQAVWNHIFLSLVAYGLLYLIKLKTQSKKSTWEWLILIRLYSQKSWSSLEEELFRKPSKISAGRQIKAPPSPRVVEAELFLKKSKPCSKKG